MIQTIPVSLAMQSLYNTFVDVSGTIFLYWNVRHLKRHTEMVLSHFYEANFLLPLEIKLKRSHYQLSQSQKGPNVKCSFAVFRAV